MIRRAAPLLIALALLPAGNGGQFSQSRRLGRGGSIQPNGTYKDAVATFRGKLKQITKKEIVIQTDEDQVVTIRRSGKTKFFDGTKEIKATDMALDMRVSVDASQDMDLKPTALTVMLESGAKRSLSDAQKSSTPDKQQK